MVRLRVFAATGVYVTWRDSASRCQHSYPQEGWEKVGTNCVSFHDPVASRFGQGFEGQ
jgi:hypothetical protein